MLKIDSGFIPCGIPEVHTVELFYETMEWLRVTMRHCPLASSHPRGQRVTIRDGIPTERGVWRKQVCRPVGGWERLVLSLAWQGT